MDRMGIWKKTVVLDSVDRGSLGLSEGIDHVLRCVRLKFHKNLRGQNFEEMRFVHDPLNKGLVLKKGCGISGGYP